MVALSGFAFARHARRLGLIAVVILLTLVFLTSSAQADDFVFNIDPRQSSFSAEISVRFDDFSLSLPVISQGDAGVGTPGYSTGMSFPLNGALVADIGLGSIEFSSFGSLLGMSSGSWLPTPAIQPTSGATAPGSVGGLVDGGVAGRIAVAIRNLVTYVTSDPLTLSPALPCVQAFDSQLNVKTKAGALDVIGQSGLFANVPGTRADLHFGIFDVVNSAPAATLTSRAGGGYDLVVPMNLEFTWPFDETGALGLGPINVDFKLQGQLVAQADAVVPRHASFETPGFSPWNTIGAVQRVDFDSTEGAFSALLSNGAGAQDVTDVEDALGFSQGFFNSALTMENNELSNGSAMQVSFHANAGDVVAFDWNYLSNDPATFNDKAFVTIGDDTWVLDQSINPDLVPSPSSFVKESGFHRFAYTVLEDGDYTLTISIFNELFDSRFFSGILIDNVQIPGAVVPEPSSLVLAASSIIGLFLVRRRSKRNQAITVERNESKSGA